MRNILRLILIPLACAAVFAAASCTVRQDLTLDGSGGGSATVTVNLSPVLLSYYSDLMSAMTGVTGDYPVVDLEQLEAEFASRPSLDLIEAERTAWGQLRLELTFKNLNDVLTDATGDEREPLATDVFTFESHGVRRELTVRLDREVVNSFLSFAPAESATMMQFLLPPTDGSVSRDEYREELAWALEEYGSADEVMRVLEQSSIEVIVRPAGRIQSQTGGSVRGDTVVFNLPILELLTLTEQRTYGVVFVP